MKEHAEVVNVAALSADGLIVTLDRPLEYTHQGETLGPFGNPPFDRDTNFIEVRAEVGLLSRNVVIQGDQDSVSRQFGATVMMFSPGDESLTARIENIEVRRAGQAHRLGRYPLHFHMIGTVRRSYARSNSVHTTYNRAFAIHGVHYLRVQHNVAYNVMGHAYFIEDAIETKNIIEYNLGVLTRRSYALLNTDITPATFWITNPDNLVRHNHAAGSDNYGFWYRAETHVTGASAGSVEALKTCPKGTPLLEFFNNTAHSNGRYGLRIYDEYFPKRKPCERHDATTNPCVDAQYRNFYL